MGGWRGGVWARRAMELVVERDVVLRGRVRDGHLDGGESVQLGLAVHRLDPQLPAHVQQHASRRRLRHSGACGTLQSTSSSCNLTACPVGECLPVALYFSGRASLHSAGRATARACAQRATGRPGRRTARACRARAAAARVS